MSGPSTARANPPCLEGDSEADVQPGVRVTRDGTLGKVQEGALGPGAFRLKGPAVVHTLGS